MRVSESTCRGNGQAPRWSLPLGYVVLNAAGFLATHLVIVRIVVIGVLAYLFDLPMRRVERTLVPWKGRM